MGGHAMNRRRSHERFLDKLKEAIRSLKEMKPGEVHVFNINASYGRYQVVIGPEGAEARKGAKEARPIEINGEIHHLFVSPGAVRIHPSRRQVNHYMQDTVIMRDLSIHIVDPEGGGEKLARSDRNGMRARECINLAGNEGQKIIERTEQDGRMMMAAYRIVQQDILKALKDKREKKAR